MSRTWFVTGASSGLGLEITERLLARGERVAATVRASQRLADLAARHGDRLWTAELDVTDTAALRAVVDRAFAELGRIDVIVSNAGRGLFGAAEELADDDIDEQVALNFVAPVQLTRAVLPHLRAQGGGRIVQISTMGGQFGSAGGSMYHASKWGVEGFFESIADEVASFGIGVTLVEPGAARTGFGRAMKVSEPLEAYAEAIIASVAVSPAPLRLPLGSDAYKLMHGALTDRLAHLEVARETALSTDADDFQGEGVVARSASAR